MQSLLLPLAELKSMEKADWRLYRCSIREKSNIWTSDGRVLFFARELTYEVCEEVSLVQPDLLLAYWVLISGV